MKRYVIGALALAMLSTGARAEEMLVSGVGAATCAQFAKLYQGDPKNTGLIFLSWAQGFLSGWNIGQADSKVLTLDLSVESAADQETFVREFCDQHPLKNYVEAVTALAAELKYKTARNSTPGNPN